MKRDSTLSKRLIITLFFQGEQKRLYLLPTIPDGDIQWLLATHKLKSIERMSQSFKEYYYGAVKLFEAYGFVRVPK